VEPGLLGKSGDFDLAGFPTVSLTYEDPAF